MSTGYEQIRSVDGSSWKAMGVDKKSISNEEFERVIEQNKIQTLDKIKEILSSGNSHTFVNDHNGQEEKLEGVVMLDNNYICPIFMYNICCLNKLYVGKDEKIHLSTSSVASLFGRCESQTDGSKESFMKSAIEYYNKHTQYSPKIIDYKII